MITDLRKLKPDISMLRTLRGSWRQHPRYRGCITHFLLNEGGGFTAYDLSSSKDNGALTNMPASAWQTSQRGTLLDFDPADDFIDSPWGGSLDVFSISVSVKPASISAGSTVFGDTGAFLPFLQIGGGAINPWNWSNTAGTEANKPVVGKWQVLVGTTKGVDQKFYVDGLLDATNLAGDGDNLTEFRIGKRFDEFYFDGLIDDFRLYNRELSPTEILSLYKQPFLEFEWAFRQMTSRRYLNNIIPSVGGPTVNSLMLTGMGI